MTDIDSIDFAAIGNKAQEFLDNADKGTPPAEPVQATPAPAPASQATPVETAPKEQKPQPVQLADDALFSVTRPDGTVEEISGKQLRAERLMQQDYTKKTQEVAKQRKEIEQVVTAYEQLMAEREQVINFLNNPDAVLEHLQKAYPDRFNPAAQPQQPQFAPDEIATVEQARQIAERQAAAYQQQLARQMEDLQKTTQKEIAQAVQTVEATRQTAELAKEINSHLTDIFTSNPVLKSVDGLEDMLRWKVYQQHPETLEETKEAFSRAAQEQVERLNKYYQEANKEKVIAKEKLVNAIEPPGGSGIQPQPKSFVKNGQVNWKDLAQSAASFLDQGSK